MTSRLNIGVGGALGRMGRAVTTLVRSRADLRLAGRFDRPGAPADAADPLPLSAAGEVLSACDVVVDFSTGPATASLAGAAAALGRPALVLGATGLTADEDLAILQASRRIAIVRSGNYSVGINVLAGLAEQAARRLPAEIWDVEIIEAHHRGKVDAPSGTALLLGEAVARGRGKDLSALRTPARDGITGPRRAGDIGFAALRGGGIVGEHAVMFAAEDEIITFAHSARDRALFARGAVEAAAWVAGRAPGLYDMIDVLGFRS